MKIRKQVAVAFPGNGLFSSLSKRLRHCVLPYLILNIAMIKRMLTTTKKKNAAGAVHAKGVKSNMPVLIERIKTQRAAMP